MRWVCLLGAALLVGGCGRLGFDYLAVVSPDASDATVEAGLDAGVEDSSAADVSDEAGADAEADGMVDSGTPDPLATSAAVSRFFFDESTTSADGVVTLTIFEATPGDPRLEVAPGRSGLVFSTVGSDARACTAVAGTPLAGLDGASAATLETVVDIDEGVVASSRIANFGIDDNLWGFGLGYASDTDRIGFAMNRLNQWHGAWFHDLAAAGRVVVTLVYDALAVGTDRARLYVDGVLLPLDRATTDEPAPDAIDLGAASQLCIGNRTPGARSPRGVIHYAAVYDRALTDEEIALHVERLRADDDPRP